MKRRLVTAVAAVLVLGIALWAGRRRTVAPVLAKAAVAELAQPPAVPVPAAPPEPARAEEPREEVMEDLELDAPDALTPPVIHVEVGDGSARGRAPGPDPLVPPVVDLGTIEFGRGARPTAEPLVPPVIVVNAEELEGPSPRARR